MNDLTAHSFRLMEIAEGAISATAIQQVAELGVADLMDGPRAVDELAAETSTDPDMLGRVLRLLCGRGVFTETAPGYFELLPLGELLRSDHPCSQRSIVRLLAFNGPAILAMGHTLRTGQASFGHIHQKSLFAYVRERPELSALFDAAMADISRAENAALLSELDFSRYRRIVDVGGGDGTFLMAVLKAFPDTVGVLFDQPHVVDQVSPAAFGERLKIVGGDFFEQVPAGGDLYVLKTVIHDWPDDEATKILKRCRQAIPAHGRLLLLECMLVPDDRHSHARSWDLLMAVLAGGRERTREAFEKLLADSGFRIEQVHASDSPLSAIEVVPTGPSSPTPRPRAAVRAKVGSAA